MQHICACKPILLVNVSANVSSFISSSKRAKSECLMCMNLYMYMCVAGHLFRIVHSSIMAPSPQQFIWLRVRLNLLICALHSYKYIYIYLHIYIDLQPHNIWGVSAAKHKVTVYLKHIYTYIYVTYICRYMNRSIAAHHLARRDEYMGQNRFMSCQLCKCTTTLTIYLNTLQSGTW